MDRGSFAATASLILFTSHLAVARPGGGGSFSGGGGGSRGGGGSYSGGGGSRSGGTGGGSSPSFSRGGSSFDDHPSIRAGHATLTPADRKAWSGALAGIVSFGLVAGLFLLVFARRVRVGDDSEADAPPAYRAPDRITFIPLVTLDALKSRDPTITFQSIEARIHCMSEILRDAWCAGDMRAARPFVSDGVYSRFQVQLALMRGEGRRNVMKDALIVDAELEDVETAAPLDVVHVRVQGRARDTEVALNATPEEIDRALDRVEVERYEEIWSLVRRQGATTTRDASAFGRSCASCGAALLDAQGGALPAAGEMIRCRYCGVLLCSGEHDWVLAEITQIAAWHPAWPEPAGLATFRAADPELARAALEDRASHLFWKWIEAGRLASPSPLRKCATPEFLATRARLEAIRDLRDVAVGGADLVSTERGAMDVAHVRVFWSAIVDASSAVDGRPSPTQSVLRLVRKPGVTSRASMTTLTCGRCGAGIGESDAPTCDHCGALLAAGDDAWVLDGVDSTQPPRG
jgi:DNA-directed RNA polymerase subunit RPC12/RpoP